MECPPSSSSAELLVAQSEFSVAGYGHWEPSAEWAVRSEKFGHLEPIGKAVECFVDVDLQSFSVSACPDEPPAKGCQRVWQVTFYLVLLSVDAKRRIWSTDGEIHK